MSRFQKVKKQKKTRIEPVGEPYREVCQSPWKKKLNVLKPNWLAKCFVIREKKNFHEGQKKNWNMT